MGEQPWRCRDAGLFLSFIPLHIWQCLSVTILDLVKIQMQPHKNDTHNCEVGYRFYETKPGDRQTFQAAKSFQFHMGRMTEDVFHRAEVTAGALACVTHALDRSRDAGEPRIQAFLWGGHPRTDHSRAALVRLVWRS